MRVLILVFAVATGCTTRPAPAPQPLSDQVLSEVTVPGQGAVSRARIRRRYTPELRSSGGGHGGVFGGAQHVTPARYEWVLEGDGASLSARQSLVIESRTPAAAGALLADAAAPRLSAADDGHALAFSLLRADAWSYVALDLGPRWVLFRDVQRAGDAPWAQLPTSSSLLLDALRSPGDSASRVLRVALQWLCARPDDATLARAASEVFIQQVNPLHVGYASLSEPGADCLQRAAQQQPSLRESLRAAVASPSAQRREMAAWVLSGGGASDDQDAIARALREPIPAGADVPSTGHTRLYLTWSLAALTAHRREATASALEALTAIATQPAPLPYASWRLVQVNAIRGLAAVSQTPSARATLTELARGECAHPLTALPTEFRAVNESDLDANGHPLPCWAQAALAQATPLRD